MFIFNPLEILFLWTASYNLTFFSQYLYQVRSQFHDRANVRGTQAMTLSHEITETLVMSYPFLSVFYSRILKFQ